MLIELLDLLDALGLPRAIATSIVARDRPAAIWGRTAWPTASMHVWRTTIASATSPQPDPFLKAAGRLGVAPSLCLALEICTWASDRLQLPA